MVWRSSRKPIVPCGRGVECAHRFPVCRLRRLKGCPDGSASTAWDYAGFLCKLHRDAGPKRCHHSQTSRAQSPLNPFYTWCNILLTEFHYSPVVSIPLVLPSNTSILLLSLTCTRVRGIIIIMTILRYNWSVLLNRNNLASQAGIPLVIYGVTEIFKNVLDIRRSQNISKPYEVCPKYVIGR